MSVRMLDAAEPGTKLAIPEPLRFGNSVAEDIEHMVLLREATSRMIRLSWRLSGIPAVDFRSLVHLLPPADCDTPESDPYAQSWRAGYRYGLYYYRRGQGFVQVKDVRPDGPCFRITIDDTDRFYELAHASWVSQLSGQGVQALNDAIAADLAIADGGRFVLLPYRMAHWPVPCMAV
jgi:hypothetical protein